MNSNKIIVSICLMLLAFSSIHGQIWKLNRYEIQAGAGFSNYFGDIGGTADKNNWFGLKDIQIDETSHGYGAAFKYRTTKSTAIKASFDMGSFKATDINSRNERRALSFTSNYYSLSVKGEYLLLRERIRSHSSLMNFKYNYYTPLSVYVFAGLGTVYTNPKLKGDFSNRKPTEVSGYSNFHLSTTAGLGIKYRIDNTWAFGAEFGPQFLMTDYADGFASVNSNSNDMFYQTSVYAIYMLRNNRNGKIIFDRYKRKRR